MNSYFLKLLAFPISQGPVKFLLLVLQKESGQEYAHIFCAFI